MLEPSKEELKKAFARQRETLQYREDLARLVNMEFHEFMKEFLAFHQRVTRELEDELGHNHPTVEEREWFYLYYGGELFSDAIKANQWGRMVDMALSLMEKEQEM